MSLKLTLLSLAAMIALVPGQAAAVSAGPALAANAGHPAVGRALGIIRNNGGSSWTRSFVLLIEDPKVFVARSDFCRRDFRQDRACCRPGFMPLSFPSGKET